jgi:hypothetical protein
LRSGTQSCVNGSVQNSCVAGAPAPFDSTCDGVDDNCNGAVDEGFVSVATTCGVGACASTGSTSCSAGVVHNSCTPGTPAPSDVSCDNVDDNCNGAVDEGYVSQSTSCGVGACASTGSTSCSGGAVHDNCTPGTPAPSDATCDGVDDNCNGTNDEQYASVFMTCGIGACARSGSTSCVGGAVTNNCTPGAPLPSDATCNGVDENCNGVADEGFVPSCSGTTASTCVSGVPHSTQCLDTNPCNGTESCAAGACVAGSPVVTDDGNPCTADSCDPVLGVRHTPVASGTSCEDGNVCNGAEQCLPVAGCVTPTTGAVSWWPGDGNPTDVIGGQDGVLTNGLGFATGEVGQAFNYDGVDDVLALSSHAAALNLAGQATIELWVRIPDDTCRTVFHLRQDATHEQFLQVGNGCTSRLSNEIVTWTYNNSGTTNPTSQVGFTTTTRTLLIDATRFHHLALTFDGHLTAIYIDGVSRAVTVATGVNNGIWGNFTSPTVASLGGGAGTPAQSFSGLMDEVTLYDHALTGAQVMSIFNSATAGKCKAPTCTPGTNAPPGTSCGSGGSCDGAGVCGP